MNIYIYIQLDGALFFTYLNMLPLMLESFKCVKNGKIFIIDFHPNSHRYLFDNLEILDKAEQDKFINLLLMKKALSFMDGSYVDVISQYSNLPIEKRFIPAFVSSIEDASFCLKKKENINLGCVCRLDNDKIQTVINLLNNVYKNADNYNITFHIIGDGNSRNLIDFDKYKDKIKVIFTSYICGDDLRRYLQENVDLLFNFGVAALEAALLKLPVMIPIYEQSPHEIDKYYFLFDSKEFILGCNLLTAEKLNIEMYSIKEVLDLFQSSNFKIEFGDKCYRYLLDNHRPDVSVANFLSYSFDTLLTFDDCFKFKKVKHFVEKFSKARKAGFDWELYNLNKRKNSVFQIKKDLFLYKALFLISYVPLFDKVIKRESLTRKINSKNEILIKLNKK